MESVLPDATPPYITVEIHGVTYRYTMIKDPDTDAIVYVRNEDAIDGGYVFEERDDWSGTPGGTIQKYRRFPYIDSTRWGQGSIDVDGDGTVEDAIVVYNYKMDVDEEMMLCAATPLADPSCPGFAQALAELLRNMPKPDVDDPYYDQWVQAQLDREVDLEEEEQVEREEEQEEEDFERQMGGTNSVDAMVDAGKQAEIMAQLAQVPKIESYYIIEIPGGSYQDTVVLQDAKLPDNRRALSNLASDKTHRTMVRSQYDR